MILIALGSNLSGPWGSPRATLARALRELDRGPSRVVRVSTIITTAPFGRVNQPDFVNAVAQIATPLPPQALLRHLHDLEKQAGRRRALRWGPRTLDLDLLDYHGLVIRPRGGQLRGLELPHPGIMARAFVRGPLAEIAPRWRHPVSRRAAALTIRKP
jgi:2-amino-4-hydroxy-6-hydroxymethyldihydropteridine diphosphokinase